MIVWGGNAFPTDTNTGGKIQPKHRYLDSYEHWQRAESQNGTYLDMDRERDDRLRRKW